MLIVQRNDPNIAKFDWVVVVLEKNGAHRGLFLRFAYFLQIIRHAVAVRMKGRAGFFKAGCLLDFLSIEIGGSWQVITGLDTSPETLEATYQLAGAIFGFRGSSFGGRGSGGGFRWRVRVRA